MRCDSSVACTPRPAAELGHGRTRRRPSCTPSTTCTCRTLQARRRSVSQHRERVGVTEVAQRVVVVHRCAGRSATANPAAYTSSHVRRWFVDRHHRDVVGRRIGVDGSMANIALKNVGAEAACRQRATVSGGAHADSSSAAGRPAALRTSTCRGRRRPARPRHSDTTVHVSTGPRLTSTPWPIGWCMRGRSGLVRALPRSPSPRTLAAVARDVQSGRGRRAPSGRYGRTRGRREAMPQGITSDPFRRPDEREH